jgi:hypothetical protein
MIREEKKIIIIKTNKNSPDNFQTSAMITLDYIKLNKTFNEKTKSLGKIVILIHVK